MAGRVANAGLLDLDDVRAQVAQQGRHHRPSQQAPEVEDVQAGPDVDRWAAARLGRRHALVLIGSRGATAVDLLGDVVGVDLGRRHPLRRQAGDVRGV